ncbi:hypothetical protein [Sphingomonas alpina]|uniref:Uncharacterized protein n=1 Tax=Sphingomonas alpina TaxID=653931 RepID=A0A7H0LHV9_9SPHN|nr:hypothetical protein [Sphingomonas alpina]QNQ09262.1 hypothetical protein H3Z74_21750 [Sphingomonas alpina]
MRIRHQRDFYIPKGAICVRDRASSAVAYIYTSRRKRPAAVVFQGKAQKPAWDYSFLSDADRTKRVGGFFKAIQRIEQGRVANRAERKAWQHPYKPGDVFSTCWGYDQTNREYYECTEVRGKHLIVRQIASGYVETQWLAGKAVPMPGQYVGEATRVLAQQSGFRAPKNGQWASFDKPTIIAGVPTYDAQHVSSYA